MIPAHPAKFVPRHELTLDEQSAKLRLVGGTARQLWDQACAGTRSRGRPPLRPFFRAAAALASDDWRPPRRPSSDIHPCPSNADDTSDGTLRSRSR